MLSYNTEIIQGKKKFSKLKFHINQFRIMKTTYNIRIDETSYRKVDAGS